MNEFSKISLTLNSPKKIPKVNTFAFEGLPATGKSTALNTLKSLEIISVYIPTLMDFSRKKEVRYPFTEFPVSTENQAKDNVLYFLELEKLRKEYFISLLGNSTKGIPIATIDGSFLGILVYEYATREITGFDIFSWAISQVLSRINDIILPDGIIYFDLEAEKAKKRSLLDKTKTRKDIWYENTYATRYAEFFELLNNEAPQIVNKIDAEKSREKVVEQIISIIDSKK